MKYRSLFLVPVAAILWFSVSTQAALVDLLPNLAADNPEVRTLAVSNLMAEASLASRPDAESERIAYSESICHALSQKPPALVAAPLLRQLQRIGGEEAIETLGTWLGHPDAHLRDEARQALEANPSPRAGQALVAALAGSDDPRFSAGILDSLGARGHAESVPVLASFVDNEQDAVSASAVNALARIPNRASVLALLGARKESEGARHDRLTTALIDLAGHSRRAGQTDLATNIYKQLLHDNEPERVRAIALGALMVLHPDRAQGLAQNAFEQAGVLLHGAVADAAAQIQSAPLNQFIATHYDQASPEIQVRLLGALEFSGDPSLAERIVPALQSGNKDVARAAALALGRIGTPESVEPLLAATASVPEATTALGMLNVPGAEEQIRAAAATGEPGARKRAIDVLGERAGDGIVPLLLAYVREPDSAVSSAALEALKKTTQVSDFEQVVNLMLDAGDPGLGKRALGTVVQLLKQSGDPTRSVSLLSSRLPDAPPASQALIFQALMRAGTDAALVPVKEAASAAPQSEAGQAAFKSLTSWPEPNAIPTLLEFAGKDLELGDHVAAMRGLARLLGNARKVDLDSCEKALALARRPEEIKLLLGAIGKSRGAKALELLAPYLENPDVRAEAQAATDAVNRRASR